MKRMRVWTRMAALAMVLVLSACGSKTNTTAPKETTAIAAEKETTAVPTKAETTEAATTAVPTEAETEEVVTEAETEAEAETEPIVNDVVTPSFKETMDAYEAFFDEYVEFMQSYDASDMSQLMEYTTLMTRYMDAMQKMSDLESEAMTDADLAYYIDVTARIEKKLLSAAS